MEACGPGVERVAVGQRVVPVPSAEWSALGARCWALKPGSPPVSRAPCSIGTTNSPNFSYVSLLM